MKNGLRIIPFKSSDSDFQILYELKKSLDYKVEYFGSVEMLSCLDFSQLLLHKGL